MAFLIALMCCWPPIVWHHHFHPTDPILKIEPDVSASGSSGESLTQERAEAEAKYDAFSYLRIACRDRKEIINTNTVSYEIPECWWTIIGDDKTVVCTVKATAHCDYDPEQDELLWKPVETKKKIKKPTKKSKPKK